MLAPEVHPTLDDPEEQWQRAIRERMVTPKTPVGLKKHIEVCQKLQEALKCQHWQ